MAPPAHPPAPPPAEPPHWTTRLQRFGQGAIALALFGVFLLWLHELFVDPAIRQAWKLKLLMGLIPLAVLGAAALLLAWLWSWGGKLQRKP